MALETSTQRFDTFPLCAATQRAIKETMGFTHLTPVQDQTLPVILEVRAPPVLVMFDA